MIPKQWQRGCLLFLAGMAPALVSAELGPPGRPDLIFPSAEAIEAPTSPATPPPPATPAPAPMPPVAQPAPGLEPPGMEPVPAPAPTPVPAPEPSGGRDLDRLEFRSMAGPRGGVCDEHFSGFDEDANDGVFVSDPQAEDGAACEFFARAGSDGGGVGGRVFLPGGFGRGDAVHFAIRVKLEEGWESPIHALKWMRFRVGHDYSNHAGFINFLLNRPTLPGQTPYKYSTSLANGGTSNYFGAPDVDDPAFGSYDVYEAECVLDDVPVDEGGLGECSLWRNGERLGRMTHTRTLTSAGDQVHWSEFVGTFQPSAVPRDQRLWVDWVRVGGRFAN